jgi:hypothetical protein
MNQPTTIPICFVAYPSQPRSLSETIETAIENINGTQIVEAIGWRSLNVGGRLVINEICATIDKSDLFICDLTYLNPNVLFELGYAVARNKRIWVILDSSYSDAVINYKQVKLLTTVGYSDYNNGSDIVKSFLDKQPYNNLSKTLYTDVIESFIVGKSGPPSLLYLKSAVNTEASARLTRRLQKSPVPLVTDDPADVTVQTLAWYAQNAISAHAIVAHFLDDTRSKGSPIPNAKYAFVSGLAIGLQKPLLMLAHAPFDPPFDYQNLLKIHSSASECQEIVEKWLRPIEEDYKRARQNFREHEHDQNLALALRRIHLGDHIAENEQDQLLNYFIVTSPYSEALHSSQSTIYVGRKGTGKTANLLKIADELMRSQKNHVCVIKPVDYDIEGVLELLNLSISKAEQGYLIQSLWKFLIYTELAISLRETILSRPAHIPVSEEEQAFVNFFQTDVVSIEPDFTVRMENVITELCHININDNATNQRVKISEIIHNQLLGKLRNQLGKVLQSKDRVAVLVDNLDKAWRPREDLPILSDFIFGLLSVTRAITDEFGRAGSSWRQVNLSLTVFLRSDIFSYIMSQAREGDKLSFSRIDWVDEKLLQRVIEERFVSSLDGQITPEDVWRKYFISEVAGLPTKQYLTQQIIPRPRDIIFLCKASLSYSVNHSHSLIEEEDILKGMRDYSQYAYLTLVTETKPIFPKIEELLIEFAGRPEIITDEDIRQALNRASLTNEPLDPIVDLLIDSLFLGIETEPNSFRFLYDENRANVLRSLARSNSQSKENQKYRINPPFHAYLEIVKE